MFQIEDRTFRVQNYIKKLSRFLKKLENENLNHPAAASFEI